MDTLNTNDLKNLKSFFSNRTKELKEEKNQLLSLIAPHLEEIERSSMSELDKQKNRKELNEVGEFLNLLDKSITIDSANGVSPGFLIRIKGQLIGLDSCEITLESKDTKGAIERMFREIEEELKEEAAVVKGVYKIEFNDDTAIQTQMEAVKTEIKTTIRRSDTVLNFIKEITKSTGDTIHLYTNDTPAVTLESVEMAISAKENHLKSYKSSSKENEFWLLLVLSDTNDFNDSPSIDNSIVISQFETGYQKVFLFDPFQSRIVELKIK